MSSDDLLELSSNQLQTLKTSLKQYKTLVASLASPSTPSSPATSAKIHKMRAQYLELEGKLNKSLSSSAASSSSSSTSREWDALKKEAKTLHDEFARADKVVQIHHYEDQQQNASGNGSSAAAANAGSSGLSQMKKVNTAGLDTELEYQRQRLEGIRDIEQSANEVREMFHDFNTMVKLQQGGLDIVSKNLDQAAKHVTNGADEIRKARKM